MHHAGKKFDMSMVPPEEQPVFTITPEKAIIEPKESATFMINGFAHLPGEIVEQMICMATVGANSKTQRKVYDLALQASVATPLLDVSERLLQFHHMYKKGVPIETLTKSLTLRCVLLLVPSHDDEAVI